ncbi:GNAT family N-acetyltransferase [Butyrivibrio sp. X503]|uniref:GNAT family N-acetyltransferase n=1 Tax=Butyrivibrio sp. X503 TaxID=2364878 RepID=UPI001FA96E44|nr:GNAT family N-acetyltransferase [Butyrivibrio sp. X503]
MAEQIREDAEKEEQKEVNISLNTDTRINESITEKVSEDINLVVRRATAKDIPFLLALLSQVLEVHARIKPDYFVSGHTKYSSTELEDILDDDSKRVYVAEKNEAVIGYAFCEFKKMPDKPFVQQFKYMYIDDICVDKNFRGKDVAQKIFEHVKEEARALGCRDITLNVWTGNQRAFAFYQKMGMKPQKTTMEMKI